MKRIERDGSASHASAARLPEAVRPIAHEEGSSRLRLPPDHPPWLPDVLSLSARARRLAERLEPVLLRIMSYWDHRVRSLRVGGVRITVDPAGSYRRG